MFYSDINEATNLILKYALELEQTPLKDIHIENPAVFFITYNLMNTMYTELVNSGNYYVDSLFAIGASKISESGNFLMITSLTVFGVIIIFWPMLKSVQAQKEQILGLFLDIPEETVKVLEAKCDGFILRLNKSGDDEEESEHSDRESQQKA